MSYSNEEKILKAILVHININGEEENGKELLDELSLLCASTRIKEVGRLQQNLNEVNPPTLIGTGKLEELKELCKQLKADVVVFDNDLSGMKKKNLEIALEVPVYTRSMIVLDIFAMRSKTAEGKLQTEIAQLKYYLPRLIGMENVSNGKFGGGVGMRGPGETKLELDKRKIKERIFRLENDLKKLDQNKKENLKKREYAGAPNVAIVGYTNAGKSTLFNTITKAQVLSKDMLFATLETVSRYVYISDKTQIILSDTVGFINKLPHEFIKAFKSTLYEATIAKVLLLVVDATDEHCELQFNVVKKVLDEIGAKGKQITVINKTDKKINEQAIKNIRKQSDFCVNVSALKNEGIEELKNLIEKLI